MHISSVFYRFRNFNVSELDLRVCILPEQDRPLLLICIFFKEESTLFGVSYLEDTRRCTRRPESRIFNGAWKKRRQAQINSRWVYRLWKCTFDSSQFHESLRLAFFVSNAKRIFIVTLGGIEWLADRDTYFEGPDGYCVDTESPIRDTFERALLPEFALSSRFLTIGDPFRAAIPHRESLFDRTDGDLSFRLLTAGSPEEWPRKCYPLECPSIPPLFISLSFFSRLSRVVENSLGGFGRVNSPLACIHQKLFPRSKREPTWSHNVHPLPAKKFFRVLAFGRSKTSRRRPRRRRCRRQRERDACEFSVFVRTTSPEELLVSFLSLVASSWTVFPFPLCHRRWTLFLFRIPSSFIENVPTSLRNLLHSWRK